MDNEVMGQTKDTPSDNEKQDIIGKCSRCGGELHVDHTFSYHNKVQVWLVCENCDTTDLLAVYVGSNQFEIVRQEDV